ncbi:MAG: hypothetical protein MI746_06725 [Pseudomonadales bacterium]|nr:hypothetical protein [Pseudomonadales bacterium]
MVPIENSLGSRDVLLVVRDKAEAIFEVGAYSQYVTTSKIASNAVSRNQGRIVIN